MANYWVFRDGQTNKLEHHDIGSATLKDFLAANPSLGPVRRGTVADPTYIAPTSYGGNVEAPVVEQSDPTSAEPAFKATEPPAFVPFGDEWAMKNLDQSLLPLEYRGLSLEEIIQKAQQVIDQGLYDAAAAPGTDAFDLGVLNQLANALTQGGASETLNTIVQYYENSPIPEVGTGGFANLDAFSPENRFGTGSFDEDGNYIDASSQFADSDSETAGALEALNELLPTNLSAEQSASVAEFMEAMRGPLFDENGNPIFPELPMEVFSKLLGDKDLAPYIGPILQDLIGNRSTVIQNITSNAANIQATQAQFNPLGRTAESDRSLQDMLAQREIERTKAQFNPFGLSTAQGVSAIQDQFNPYAQDAAARQALAETQFNPYAETAADRLALAKQQFNPYDQTADNRTALINAQFNPYGFSQAQGLEGISRQFNPYGETAADRLALAGMAQNPFGRTQLQDQQLQTALARGGLSADERLAEIRASNNPLNTQNFLSFLGNPSAVGTAVSLGNQGFLNQLGGGQGLPQQSPQTLNPLAPLVQQLTEQLNEQNVASSPAVDTGSADFSFGPMKPFDPAAPTPTSASLRDRTEEELAFLEGSAAAQGYTPSALGREVAGVTPGGVTTGRGWI